ncbi:cytidine deaminase [Kingella negevensis]|uniref:cytidine deaminase n=1 Tax=Kingella negevensis TaxID=1522312 RepID=UPI00050A17C1|nr:cytidine deaminase [Kingella negevensis]MDK4688161.1 cytidine deaminase [Kingella negevensis]WII90854.1 cytidine deaminase [Kingella negevensis]
MTSFLNSSDVNQKIADFNQDKIALALSLLPEAAKLAVVPVSQFHVGAIAIDEDSNFYFGANQECATASMGQTVHAEQSAISHAWQRGAKRITDIVVNYTPCGHCRQFLNELRGAEELKIHLPHSRDNLLSSYLPDSFSPKDLDMEERLLDHLDNPITEPAGLDKVAQAAFQAAKSCYAPYSKAYAGVALDLSNEIITGRYAENAAYNPTLPPLQVAINLLRLSGHHTKDVKRAVLVCTEHGGHQEMTNALWEQVGECKLETVFVK